MPASPAPYTVEVFCEKVQLVYDHVLSTYGDDGQSVYTRRGDINFPAPGTGVEPGLIDINKSLTTS